MSVVLLVFVPYMLWLLLNDVRRREPLSPALWGVVVWLTLIGSRPVSAWFDAGLDFASASASYDEGNPLERAVYFVLIAQGLVVLLMRGVRPREVAAANPWLLLFLLYGGLSVFWADAPFVAFKRWVKDLGNLVMVLVILSDGRPVEAMKAAFVRCACVLLPVSVLFIRFIPELGRTYHSGTGEMMFTGVATHKNSLGLLVLVCLLFLLWDLASRTPQQRRAQPLGALLGDVSLLAIAVWLLVRAESATALGCAALGVGLLAAMAWGPLRRRARLLELLVASAAVALWASDGVERFTEYMIVDVMGRDLTLTTRTDVWPMLLAQAESVWWGAGFNSFWTGERLDTLYGQLGIIQAHNGYLETYLNGGLTGLVLLGLMLLGSLRAIHRGLAENRAQAGIAFAVLIVSAVYNLTEASFNKINPLWFALLLTALPYRAHKDDAPVVPQRDRQPGSRPLSWQARAGMSPTSGTAGAPGDGPNAGQPRLPNQAGFDA